MTNMTSNSGQGAVSPEGARRGPGNAAMAAVLRDELEDRDWSPKVVGTKSQTLEWRTIYRIVNNEKEITIGEIIELGRILDIPADELMRRAVARQARDELLGQGVPDPRAVARYLLDHPEEDSWLVGHLSELEGQSGASGDDALRLADEVRYQRRQHLLEVLNGPVGPADGLKFS